MEIAISLFGTFEFSHRGERSKAWDKEKVQELLAFLFLKRDRSHSRETLANLLWQNIPLEQSRRYLRKTLWQLKAPLEKTQQNELLIIFPDRIQFNKNADVWCDVQIVEDAFMVCRGVEGRHLTEEQIQLLKDAVEAYRGDLLEGNFMDWCVFERERLRRIHLILLDKLIQSCIINGRFEEGVDYCYRVLSHDSAHERTHRQLMRLYYLDGDRTRALRQFQSCAKFLQDELNIKPTQRSNKLYMDILNDDIRSVVSKNTIQIQNESQSNMSNEEYFTLVHKEMMQTNQKISTLLDLIQTKFDSDSVGRSRGENRDR